MGRTSKTAIVTCVAVGLVGCSPSGEEVRESANQRCKDFEEVFTTWDTAAYRHYAELVDNEPPTQPVVAVADRAAEEVLDEELRENFSQMSGSSNDIVSFRFDGEEVIQRCQDLGIAVSKPQIPDDAMDAVEDDSPSDDSVAEGTPRSDADRALQREALELMWSSTAAAEKEATCEAYNDSPDSLIEGFISSAEDQFDEQVVREFYAEKC